MTDIILKFQNKPYLAWGICRVRIFPLKEGSAAIISEIDDNPGPSVTNSIENIVRKLRDEGKIDRSAVIIEHYEPGFVNDHTYDIVTFDDNMQPDWKGIDLANACEICNTSETQLTSVVSDDEMLMAAISNILAPSEPEEKTAPQFDVYKNDVRKLINNNAGEREMQTLLKSDLSLFAEIYADPKDEYICFSEFPVGEKKADFVLFTGRSKMSVIIIEVKGADFYFSNQGTYKKVNEKISTCKHQVITCINQINKQNYERFSEFCHAVRQQVENGTNIFNSRMGPKKQLNVDPRKGIKIYGVVIGGKTRDDLYESTLRHNEEDLLLVIRIESWDSWLNKLTRPDTKL